ncbi:hypothetical protein G6L37_07305 [Agrobacterium rubi]|nr:hypothetical protein [Agrobacterium rubi]NTF25174.1 hypothetical protein [Agrobacterium rubi]
MTSMYAIGWFIGMIASVWLIFHMVGFSGVTRLFPEGRRWWHLPTQLASLAPFAVLILFHPFGGSS